MGRSSIGDGPQRAAEGEIAAAGSMRSSPGAACVNGEDSLSSMRRPPSLRDNGCFVRECAVWRSRVVPRFCVLILWDRGVFLLLFP